MDQLLTLLRTHLPVGGFAHIRGGTNVTLTLGDSWIRFQLDPQVLEASLVGARIFIRNTVLAAIERLKQEANGTRLPTE